MNRKPIEDAVLEIFTPASKEKLSRFKIGDVIRLTGVIHTLRDAGYERLLKMISKEDSPPVDFKDGAVWHCGPIVKKMRGDWIVLAAGPTTSSRFTLAVAEVFRRLKAKIVVGKGPIGHEAVEAIAEEGGVYLATTGGAAAYYASQIERVESEHWMDLGMPAALWSIKVKLLGPLIVAVDSHGGDLFLNLNRKVEKRMKRLYRVLGIDPFYSYVWWPKKKGT